MPPLTLLDVLADVPDPRSPHGRIHPLPAVLALVVLALLHGHQGPTAISEFGRNYGPPLAWLLGFRRGKTPAPSSLCELLARLDVAAFEAALSRWIASRLPAAEGNEPQAVSLDGKTLRGSRDGETPGQHLVSAYAHEQQAVLAQMRVDAKTNEHKAALELLGFLPVRGRVILGDAMFCQRDVCAKIVAQGGDYLFTVKGNQHGLEIDIAAGFGFEVAARKMAAIFSPRAVAGTGARARSYQRRQGPRAVREADGANHVDPDVAPEMAGVGAGIGDHAGADGERKNDGGSGVCDDQPEAGTGRCPSFGAIGA